jgi:two-component system sensor histidine kinase BaeS
MVLFNIQRKVFLATLALATAMALLLVQVARWNLGQGFERYATAAEFARVAWVVDQLEAAYAAHGNWDFMRAAPEETWRRMLRPARGDGAGPPPPPRPADAQQDFPPGPPPLAGERRVQAQAGDSYAPTRTGDTRPRRLPGGREPLPRRARADGPPPGPPGRDPRGPDVPPGRDPRGPDVPPGRDPRGPDEPAARGAPAQRELTANDSNPQAADAVDRRDPQAALASNTSDPQGSTDSATRDPPGAGGAAPPRLPPGPGDSLGIAPRLALYDADGTRLAGNSGAAPQAERPIRYNGATVGRLTLQAAPGAAQELHDAFMASQKQNILLAAVAALGLSLAAAWGLSRHLLAPIRDLADATRRIAGGALDARIAVTRGDELGELGSNFNEMARRLARTEASRRTWISETSHELRTPLAVLRAEIEAIQDGVRLPDSTELARMHKQVQQLATLVDDLRLTLDGPPGGADMHSEPLQPLAVLRESLAAFRDRYQAAHLAIDTGGLPDAPWRVRGDAGRLTQVFNNLLENTLRYTHRGGQLRITAHARDRRLILHFDDTAPAPPRDALPHLFERFFRAEPSRSRVFGGSGLGLAICKTLIEAHGGRIGARLSKLGGLAIRIELPLEGTA